MGEIAKKAGLNRESLYKALGETGNPEFGTVMRIVRALGSNAFRAPGSAWTDGEAAPGRVSDGTTHEPPTVRRPRLRRILLLSLLLLVAYALLAYLVLPAFWTHYEHQKRPRRAADGDADAQGIPGDPINVGLVGDRGRAVRDARGRLVSGRSGDAASSIEIVGSVLLDRPYRDAPVSSLFYLGPARGTRVREAGRQAAPTIGITSASGKFSTRARKAVRSGSATPPSIAASASATIPARSPITSPPISTPSEPCWPAIWKPQAWSTPNTR